MVQNSYDPLVQKLSHWSDGPLLWQPVIPETTSIAPKTLFAPFLWNYTLSAVSQPNHQKKCSHCCICQGCGEGVIKFRHENHLVMLRKHNDLAWNTHVWWHRSCRRSRQWSMKNTRVRGWNGAKGRKKHLGKVAQALPGNWHELRGACVFRETGLAFVFGVTGCPKHGPLVQWDFSWPNEASEFWAIGTMI